MNVIKYKSEKNEKDWFYDENTVRPKSINAVSRANFGIVIGVHPSTLQIKKKKTDQDHSWALLRPENWAYFIKATYRRSQF